MLKVGPMTLLVVALSLSAATFADDALPTASDDGTLLDASLSAQALYEQWNYSARWKLSHPVEAPAYSNEWSRAAVNIDFHDSGTVSRLSKLRNLSLLTFAEIGKARLFLGVDDNGIVGLHLRAFHRLGDERYLEVVRMPYLKKNEPAAVAK